LIFSAPLSKSSSDSINDHSFDFSAVSSNILQKTKEIVHRCRILSRSPSLNNFHVSPTQPHVSPVNHPASPAKLSPSSQNIFTLLADSGPTYKKKICNETDKQLDIINNNLSRPSSPKRSHPSSDSSCSTPRAQTPKKLKHKKVKAATSISINHDNLLFNNDYRTATIGTVTLTWPPYGINDALYAGQSFTIVNTCPIDTGLFVLYHAYKSSTDNFRNLFDIDTHEICTFLRRTFQIIESKGWTDARLYWLTEKNLLRNKTKHGQYDLKNTMDEVVFKFLKPMQTYPLKSKCTCSVCPKPIRNSSSVEIQLE
jgi:hypothetical protein